MTYIEEIAKRNNEPSEKVYQDFQNILQNMKLSKGTREEFGYHVRCYEEVVRRTLTQSTKKGGK